YDAVVDAPGGEAAPKDAPPPGAVVVAEERVAHASYVGGSGDDADPVGAIGCELAAIGVPGGSAGVPRDGGLCDGRVHEQARGVVRCGAADADAAALGDVEPVRARTDLADGQVVRRILVDGPDAVVAVVEAKARGLRGGGARVDRHE